VKRILLIIAAILAATVLGLAVLLSSEGALQWAFARVAGLVPGELRVQTLHGDLLGPIHAREIVYRDAHTELNIGDLVFDWHPAALLRATVHITQLDVDNVQLHQRSTATSVKPSSLFVLPIHVEVDMARLTNIVFTPNTGEPVTLARVELSGSGLGTRLYLKQLALEGEQYSIASAGRLNLSPPYRLDLDLHWSVRASPLAPLSGHGWLRGDSHALVTEQQLAPPWSAQLKASASDVLGAAHWKAALTTDNLDPAAWRHDWPTATLRAEIEAEGDSQQLAAHGHVDATYAGRALDGEVRVRVAESGVKLETLTLREKEGDASLSVTGVWQPGVTDPMALKGTWQSLHWPLSGVTQARSPTGSFTVAGTFNRYRVGVDALLELAGSLHTRPMHLTGDMTAAGERYTLHGFDLRASKAHFTAAGSIDQQWGLAWQLEVPDLAEVLPDAIGNVSANGRVSGALRRPNISAQVSARSYALHADRIDALDSMVELDLADLVDSHLTLKAEGLRVSGFDLGHIEFDAQGRLRDHRLRVSMRRTDVHARLEAAGGLQAQHWRGILLDSELDNPRVGIWRLRKAAAIEIGADMFAIAALCLDQDAHHACVDSTWRTAHGGQANAQLSGVPLAVFEPWIADAKLEGRVTGQTHLAITANGGLSGELAFASAAGSLQLGKVGDATTAIGFENITLQGSSTADRVQVNAALSLTGSGSAHAELNMPFAPLKAKPTGEREVQGKLHVQLDELGLLTLFVPELLQPRGRLQLQAELGGSLDKPEISGEARLEAGRAGIAGLGITFEDVRASARSDDARHILVQAEGRSGPGTLKIDGQVELGTNVPWRAQVQVRGQEVEVIHLPEYTLIGSPDLQLQVQPRALTLDGTMNVTRATIAPRSLRAGVKSSPDVVILGAGPEAHVERTAVTANVRVILGKLVHVSTYNINADVEGDVTVHDKPGQPTNASGELRVTRGTYRAYGKDLEIDRGRLIFTGGPVDDPDVDLRAVRHVENVTAGIQARGRLQKPEVTLFSEPPLDQSDILSYIVFGTSAKQSGNAENAWLAQAVSALALATGEGLARGVGGALGIEDVRIASGVGGGTSVMLGTYLSPRLYMSYGIGLFETGNSLRLRYDLSEHWQIQTDTGDNTGADILYKIER
jgi:translocation and assembly module TamB